jgi:hypothetical protein
VDALERDLRRDRVLQARVLRHEIRAAEHVIAVALVIGLEPVRELYGPEPHTERDRRVDRLPGGDVQEWADRHLLGVVALEPGRHLVDEAVGPERFGVVALGVHLGAEVRILARHRLEPFLVETRQPTLLVGRALRRRAECQDADALRRVGARGVDRVVDDHERRDTGRAAVVAVLIARREGVDANRERRAQRRIARHFGVEAAVVLR